MHRLEAVHRWGHRNPRRLGGFGVSKRAVLVVWAAALLLAPWRSAFACGYHDPAGASVGMLNWAYPDSLHVRTAVWMAQAGGVLAAREPPPIGDPLSATFRFQQSLRLRDTQVRLEQLRERAHAALAGEPMPAFAVVLIGPMLWTRFEVSAGNVTMVQHATGPAPDDVVLVTDEVVVAALADGTITTEAARVQGLVKAYGASEELGRVSALLDRAFALNHPP
jgi:hypothetical protein